MHGWISPCLFRWYRTAPVATFDASVSMKNCSSGFGSSSDGLEVKAIFKDSKALCLSIPHFHGCWICVRFSRGLTMFAKLGTNFL